MEIMIFFLVLNKIWHWNLMFQTANGEENSFIIWNIIIQKKIPCRENVQSKVPKEVPF